MIGSVTCMYTVGLKGISIGQSCVREPVDQRLPAHDGGGQSAPGTHSRGPFPRGTRAVHANYRTSLLF